MYRLIDFNCYVISNSTLNILLDFLYSVIVDFKGISIKYEFELRRYFGLICVYLVRSRFCCSDLYISCCLFEISSTTVVTENKNENWTIDLEIFLISIICVSKSNEKDEITLILPEIYKNLAWSYSKAIG